MYFPYIFLFFIISSFVRHLLPPPASVADELEQETYTKFCLFSAIQDKWHLSLKEAEVYANLIWVKSHAHLPSLPLPSCCLILSLLPLLLFLLLPCRFQLTHETDRMFLSLSSVLRISKEGS